MNRKQVEGLCCLLGSKAILTWPYRLQTAQGPGGQAQRECTWGVQGMGTVVQPFGIWEEVTRWVGQIKTHPKLCHLSSSREIKQSPQSQAQVMLWPLPQEGFI